MTGLEMWGGVECTVVRIGAEWRDQLRETRHHEREGDLNLMANLGLRTLRCPVRAVITLPAVTGLTHHQAYDDIFAITLTKTAAVLFVILVYYATGLV